MRSIARYVMMVVLAFPAFSASAQSPLEGPLASSDAPAKPLSARVKPKPHHAAKKPAVANASMDHEPAPRAVPTQASAPRSSDPTDPVSLGMKWNGSNDNSEQTRTQNYGGAAQGTGAEVGLKLHF